jgi:hypothetical protein
MSCGTMDLTPLLCVNRAMQRSLLLLIYGLLLVIHMIPVIPVIPAISCVDLLIILPFLLGPLAT